MQPTIDDNKHAEAVQDMCPERERPNSTGILEHARRLDRAFKGMLTGGVLSLLAQRAEAVPVTKTDINLESTPTFHRNKLGAEFGERQGFHGALKAFDCDFGTERAALYFEIGHGEVSLLARLSDLERNQVGLDLKHTNEKPGLVQIFEIRPVLETDQQGEIAAYRSREVVSLRISESANLTLASENKQNWNPARHSAESHAWYSELKTPSAAIGTGVDEKKVGHSFAGISGSNLGGFAQVHYTDPNHLTAKLTVIQNPNKGATQNAVDFRLNNDILNTPFSEQAAYLPSLSTKFRNQGLGFDLGYVRNGPNIEIQPEVGTRQTRFGASLGSSIGLSIGENRPPGLFATASIQTKEILVEGRVDRSQRKATGKIYASLRLR